MKQFRRFVILLVMCGALFLTNSAHAFVDYVWWATPTVYTFDTSAFASTFAFCNLADRNNPLYSYGYTRNHCPGMSPTLGNTASSSAVVGGQGVSTQGTSMTVSVLPRYIGGFIDNRYCNFPTNGGTWDYPERCVPMPDPLPPDICFIDCGSGGGYGTGDDPGWGGGGGDGGGGGCNYCESNWMWTAGCSGPYDTGYCG